MAPRENILKHLERPSLCVAGLMSGTSADGIDVAITDISARRRQIVCFDTVRYPAGIRQAVLCLCNPARARVDDICHYNFLIGRLFAQALIKTCRKHNVPLDSIDLVGSHGQTIHHLPSGRKYNGQTVRSTLQIGEPSVIAEMTGITTVADFRPRDIACGGQGAPLVPYADYVLFAHAKRNRAVQNIGGISNLTYLPAGAGIDQIRAFDCGPGNMVIDALMALLTNGQKQYDRNGALAARGKVHSLLLRKFQSHSFFRRKPPKTTGREEFGLAFSNRFLKCGLAMRLEPADIAATATALTAWAISDSYRRFLPAMPDEVIVYGGGVRNSYMVRMLSEMLGDCKVMTTDDFGINADAKEAVSFAILAWSTIKGIANNVPSATGAGKPAILGKIIPCTHRNRDGIRL